MGCCGVSVVGDERTFGVNAGTRREARGCDHSSKGDMISASSTKPLKWVSRKGRESKAARPGRIRKFLVAGVILADFEMPVPISLLGKHSHYFP